jgi:hypothetical protein
LTLTIQSKKMFSDAAAPVAQRAGIYQSAARLPLKLNLRLTPKLSYDPG